MTSKQTIVASFLAVLPIFDHNARRHSVSKASEPLKIRNMPSKATTTSPAAAAPTSTPSKSGITTDANGQRLIPSSVRSDGSVRREIRIRPGYRPPEDVEVYKNRTAEAWRLRGAGGVPGAEPAAAPATDDGQQGKSRNAKRRAAKRRAAETAAGEEEAKKEEQGATAVAATSDRDKAAVAATTATQETEADEDAREAKKLAKKLRQARELKDKKDKGAALLPEQFEKVIRISELIRQLEALGFDAEGEKVAAGP
jgi:partner of Y14 and mago protein